MSLLDQTRFTKVASEIGEAPIANSKNRTFWKDGIDNSKATEFGGAAIANSKPQTFWKDGIDNSTG